MDRAPGPSSASSRAAVSMRAAGSPGSAGRGLMLTCSHGGASLSISALYNADMAPSGHDPGRGSGHVRDGGAWHRPETPSVAAVGAWLSFGSNAGAAVRS